MNKPQSKKETATERISSLEILITKLASDRAAALSYRRNELVDDCLEKAKKALHNAMDSLLSNEFDEAVRLSSIAWLYFSLGRKVIDAETIEHLLGESNYLELAEDRSEPEIQLGRDFGEFEQLILRVRASASETIKAS